MLNQTVEVKAHLKAMKTEPSCPKAVFCGNVVSIGEKKHKLPLTKEYILEEFKDVFGGVGTLPGE
jgi:hypothetical protein